MLFLHPYNTVVHWRMASNRERWKHLGSKENVECEASALPSTGAGEHVGFQQVRFGLQSAWAPPAPTLWQFVTAHTELCSCTDSFFNWHDLQ